MHTVAIHIDDQWVLWDVAIVQAKGFDVLATCPFNQVLGIFSQAVGERGDFRHEISI